MLFCLQNHRTIWSSLTFFYSFSTTRFSDVDSEVFLFGCVLTFAGIELILFTAASMALCFGFVLETVLVMQRCFCYCPAELTLSKGLFCFSSHPTSKEAGGAQEAGRGHSQDSRPQRTEGIPHVV